MVNMNDAFPSKHLSAADLNGAEPTVQIRSCEMEKVGDDQRPVVYFQGKEKGLVLNKTNATAISALYGPESGSWAGQSVVLFTIWTEYQGKPVQGLRVRAPAGAVPAHMVNAPMNQPNGQAPQQEHATGGGEVISDEIPFAMEWRA